MPDFLYLSPVLIGNTFILIVLIELYSIYKEASSADHIFNVGFWTGIASLFYFPFIFFFIFINAGLNILRAFSLRERLILLIGLVMPFFLSWLYYYVIGKPDYFWETQFSVNLSFLSIGGEIVGWQDYVKSGLFVLAIVIVLFNSGSYIFKRNIQSQKNISILYWIMVSSLIGALFQSNLAFEHLIMLSIPLGVFLAFTFTNMKSTMAEALHFLILIIVLALQWLPWLF